MVRILHFIRKMLTTIIFSKILKINTFPFKRRDRPVLCYILYSASRRIAPIYSSRANYIVETMMTTKTIIPIIRPIILEYSLSLLIQPTIIQKTIILRIVIKIPIIIRFKIKTISISSPSTGELNKRIVRIIKIINNNSNNSDNSTTSWGSPPVEERR